MKRLYVSPHDYIEIPDTPPIEKSTVTLESSADFGAIQYLPNPDEVLKAMNKQIDVYRSLAYDAKVKSAVGQLTSGIKSLEWDVDRGRAKSRYKKELESWTRDYDMQSMIEAHVSAWLYGYQPMEAPWTRVGTQLYPQKFMAKPQEWFVYDVKGFWKYRTKDNRDGIPIPSEYNFLFPAFEDSYTNPYGIGALSGAFWPVTFKRGGLKFWLTFIEKFGMPHIVVKVPQGASESERRTALDAGKRLIQDAVLVITETQSWELMESKGVSASSDLYHRLLSYCDDQIALSVIHQTMSSDVSDKGGGYASSKTGENVLTSASWAVARKLEQTMNLIYRRICQLNWGDVETPTFVLYEESETDVAVAERDEKVNQLLASSGRRLSMAYMQKTYKLDDEDVEETESAAAPAMPTPPEPTPPAPAPPEPPAQFAEDEAQFPDQAAVDRLVDGLADDDLQREIEPVIDPLLRAIANASNYEDALDLLTRTYPEMDTRRTEEALAALFFEATVRGRIDGGAA